MVREITNTAADISFMENTTVTFFAILFHASFTSPVGFRVRKMVLKFGIRYFRTLKMVPIGTFITANTVQVVIRKSFIAINAIFINTDVTSPWFVVFFLVQFDSVIIKVGTMIVVDF